MASLSYCTKKRSEVRKIYAKEYRKRPEVRLKNLLKVKAYHKKHPLSPEDKFRRKDYNSLSDDEQLIELEKLRRKIMSE